MLHLYTRDMLLAPRKVTGIIFCLLLIIFHLFTRPCPLNHIFNQDVSKSNTDGSVITLSQLTENTDHDTLWVFVYELLGRNLVKFYC